MTPLDSIGSERPADCAYHPGRAAPAECAQCRRPICDECRQTVADKPVCAPCVAAIRERVSSEMAAPAPVAAPNYNVGGGAAAFPPPADVAGTYAPPNSAPPGAGPLAPAAPVVDNGAPGAGRLLLGALFGLVAGVVGAFIYDKFVFYTHIQFGLVASLIGFCIGMAVMMGTGGRGGILPALMSATLSFGAMVLSHHLLLNDELGRAIATNPDIARRSAETGVTALPLSVRGMGFVIRHLDFMDWVFIAIGVYGGFSVPFRAGKVE